MKKLIIVFILLLQSLSLAQYLSKQEFKNLIGVTGQFLIQENLIAVDSNGYFYSKIGDMNLLYAKFMVKYNAIFSHHSEDLYYGIGYAMVAGIGLGIQESHDFGYKYPGLGDNFIKRWLTMNTSGDQVIKIWHPNKVGREIDNLFDQDSYYRLKKYFGGGFILPYIVHFLAKNTIASIYRSWAKYDKPFNDFRLDFSWGFWFGN